MNRPLTRTVTTTAAAAAALTFVAVVPAAAQSTKVRDRGDEESGALDIWSLRLEHSKRKVVVGTKVANLKKAKKQTFTTAIDTKKGGGAEYVSYVRFSRNPAVNLFRVKKDGGLSQPLRCDYRVAGSYRTDRFRTPIPRTCLGRPGKVRVRLVTSRPVGGENVTKDWAPGGGHRFTSWVKRG